MGFIRCVVIDVGILARACCSTVYAALEGLSGDKLPRGPFALRSVQRVCEAFSIGKAQMHVEQCACVV